MERRAFFKLVGVAAALGGVGAVSSCSPGGIAPLATPAEKGSFRAFNNDQVKFSSTVDVLIVGSGIAGLSAAMAPAEAGHSVMVAEKLELLGGESYAACGLIRVSGSQLQKDAGISTSAQDAWPAHKKELSDAGFTDLDRAEQLFLTAPQWVDHLVSEYSVDLAQPETYVSKGGPDYFLLPKNGLGDMSSVMGPLRDGLINKGVVFSTAMRASALVFDDANQVCGVRFVSEKTGAVNDVKAGCVIMATGGFSSSQEMIHEHLPAQEHLGCATFASMGEGMKLGASVGGQLVDMDKTPGLTSDLSCAASWGLFGPTLALNPTAQRFAREDYPSAVADACSKANGGFWWIVFDMQLSAGSQSRSVAQLTSKNPKRVVGPCDSLEDLAAAMQVSADSLKAAFDDYGKTVDAQKDESYNRTFFLQGLSAPYYALKQFPVRYKTYGGLTTDSDGKLLNATAGVVPKMLVCGSAAAGCLDGLSSNGASGMLAGQAALKVLEES